MPHHRKLLGSRVLHNSTTSITSTLQLDFLAPALHRQPRVQARSFRCNVETGSCQVNPYDQFFAALGQASLCKKHRRSQRQAKNQTRDFCLTGRSQNTATLRHQRYDDRGRLIIETTGPKGSDYSRDKFIDQAYVDAAERRFASVSRLPSTFFFDVRSVANIIPPKQTRQGEEEPKPLKNEESHEHNLEVQLKLLESVRQLELKLQTAKDQLDRAIRTQSSSNPADTKPQRLPLTKQDYLSLVDLYFYSHNSRFSPESSDDSPTPIVLNDYSFTLSEDFTQGDKPDVTDDDEGYVSPLAEIEKLLRKNKLREIAVMQVFVDLLLDDDSPNRALYEAYQQLPKPGVAYLPKGVIRLFLQRMSVPWVKTQASMLRYLALIDDMQKANLPINVAEWSSAIYLAGRSFSRIEMDQVARAFGIWEKMEKEAGVESSNVTFNILFDIAVRAGKFALGETILTEMHKRNLRLNRMGRVSLMFYHGLRGDGDGVRKAYHDFVEAGEIVDTLVLNCVIASLINAGEPAAADQIYQRMRSMQANLKKGYNAAGDTILFKLYPEPGSNRIEAEMAANELGRILERAPHLRVVLPDNHQQLQNAMPLTPNFTTFRIMLTYHASVSGNLDRMTVLLKEMLEDFDIPLFPVVFQLLFKGFALHGPMGGSDSPWSKTRLDMIWTACRRALLDAANPSLGDEVAQELKKVMLPSITDVNSGMAKMDEAEANGQPKGTDLSLWDELVIDLAAFPRERLKRLQRLASTHFNEVEGNDYGFKSPFFNSTDATYAAPQPELDEEEGEYTLPDPIRSTLINPEFERSEPFLDEDPPYDFSEPFTRQSSASESLNDGLPGPQNAGDETQGDEYWDCPPTAPGESAHHSSWSNFNRFVENPKHSYRLMASKPLVCWLLRAYARMTNSRAQVEEVWGSVRKIWKPKDDTEAQHVIRVLMRCLQDCDRANGR